MNNFLRFTISILLLAILCHVTTVAQAQNPLTFVIKQTPHYTLKSDTLYLSSSLDNWAEASSSNRFKLYPDGEYRLTVDIGNTKHFEYKINRGNWDKVEGNLYGTYMPNRKFHYNESIYEVSVVVESWQDLHHEVYPPIEIVLSAVPKNTPPDAAIYITGNFNHWLDNDKAFKLEKNKDGTYSGIIPPGHDTIAYKFIRGAWESIESRMDGGMRSNRTYIASTAGSHRVITEIHDWQDLTVKLHGLKAILIMFFFQGLLMLLILIRQSKNSLLITLCSFLTIGYFFKFFYIGYHMLIKYPKAYFIPTLLFGLISALSYELLRTKISREVPRFRLVYLIPILLSLAYVRYLFLPSDEFFLAIVNNHFIHPVAIYYACLMLVQQYYYYSLHRLVSENKLLISDFVYKMYLSFQFINLLLVASVIIVLLLNLQGIDVKFLKDWFEYIIWIGLGGVTIYVQWLLMIKGSVNGKATTPISKDYLNDDHWVKFRDKLSYLMEEKRVYTNPDLTLSDLSMSLGTNNQYVSRLINEGFKKSYTDYVNDYRIKAFVDSVKSDTQNKTFLNHAYQVGFNSKSAFNRAFKKTKNATPSEYFSRK